MNSVGAFDSYKKMENNKTQLAGMSFRHKVIPGK
jgi:hypothetical protein